MVRAYCFLQGVSGPTYFPNMINSFGGFYPPSQVITYDGSYPNCITATDYIIINSDDDYYLAVYQDNNPGFNCKNIFISAILIKE